MGKYCNFTAASISGVTESMSIHDTHFDTITIQLQADNKPRKHQMYWAFDEGYGNLNMAC
jgi:hypothetical protein